MESITGGNTPKYQELTEQLRLQIVSGEIAPGQKLPSENTLSAQYQVSRQTVRKALAILQNEGYIYARARYILLRNDAARTSVQEYCCCNNLSVRLYFSPCDTGN